MKRLKLLLGILAMTALLAGTVALYSPYAPVVAPVMEIEEIWAIEDARVESDVPLVTALENHGAPLGYYAQENTFYCTLGMDNGDSWPDIHLTAPGAKDVQLVFVDDYSYDWCADAIRDAYPYQVMAYTDEAFWYFDVVFTGLPIVVLEAGAEIPAHVDVPVNVSVSWQGEETIKTSARAHKRGATSLIFTPKHGLKVEFTRGAAGGRTQMNVPVLGMSDDMTLLACSTEPLMIRDRLSWEMYNAYMADNAAFADMRTAYVELFVDDEYQGVYLLMKQFDYAQEMEKENAMASLRDSYYRTIAGTATDTERPVIIDYLGNSYEQFYAPAGETDFQAIRPYLDMIAAQDDAEFSQKVLQRMDLDSIIRYALFIQACGMTDNEFNNVGIWAHQGEHGVEYRFIPWDLDMSWGIDKKEIPEWYSFELFERMLRVDCGGVIRKRTQEIWQQMRETAFNQENLEALLMRYDEELNASGAFYRNTCRWGGYDMLDTYNLGSDALDRFDMMDSCIAQIADERYAGRQIVIEQFEVMDAGTLDDRLRGLVQ